MLKNFDEDTIAAISTPPGQGGIGVVRLSGPRALAVADRIFESKNKKRPSEQASHTVQIGTIVVAEDPPASRVIDEVLLLVMRGPKSYTCEDIVEISAHGSPAVLEKILDLAVQFGARLAEPGEFTKRAFLNGRIDLLQAEAVLDLIRAKTERGRRWASAQLDGFLSRKIQNFKETLLDILTRLEASIDFSEDAPEAADSGQIHEKLNELVFAMTDLLKNADTGILLKRGIHTVICGKPNVGKSSLMNQLARSNRVIVTPYAGTTRDVVTEEIQIKGFPVRLFDTAGIQDTDHPIEKEGIRRSRQALSEADIILFVLDSSCALSEEDSRISEEIGDRKKIIVLNKWDLPRKIDGPRIKKFIKSAAAVIVELSCLSGKGIELLENEIVRMASGGEIEISEEITVSTVRQKDHLKKSLESVQNALKASSGDMSAEFVAVDVRLALDQLGVLVGETATDDILNSIFSQFCIGK
jgi:tRNA modification GTPase